MKLHLPLAVLSAVVLSACGGSSSNSDPTVDKKDPPAKTEKPAASGANNVVLMKGNTAAARKTGTLSEGNWSVASIDGMEYLLNVDANAKPSSAGTISFQYFPKQGHKAIYHLSDGSQNFRYGHIYNAQDPSDFDYFAAGAITPANANLTGKAVFNGNAFLQSERLKTLANFKADVDFDKKTLTGSFANLRPYAFRPGPPDKLDSFKKVISAQEFAGKSELGFSATIKGNQFEGGGAVGNFYGENAASLGGVIKDEKYIGAFGGSR